MKNNQSSLEATIGVLSRLWVLLIFPWVLAPTVFGEVVLTHPLFKSQLGQGLALNNQKDLKDPVVILGPVNETYNGTGDAQITVSFTQNQFDLAQRFGVNSSISVDSIAVNGHVGFDLIKGERFSENTLTFTFVGSINQGDTSPEIIDLHPDFVDYVIRLKEAGMRGAALHKAVTDHYGTHVLVGYTRAARAFVI